MSLQGGKSNQDFLCYKLGNLPPYFNSGAKDEHEKRMEHNPTFR